MTSIVGRTPTHTVQVRAAVPLTPRMRRITLGGASLVGIQTRPAQDIELILADESGRRLKRRYTIRHARSDVGEFDVDALMHPHGPGGRWASSVRVGDALAFLGPRGKLELRPAPWHLFLADEAGLPAVAALVEALPAGERALVLGEVEDGSDEIALGSAAVRWIHRGTEPAGASMLLAAALADLELPDGRGRAYLLGESRAVVALRGLVEQRGLPADHLFVKGYWNIGRIGRRIPG